jgi:hypothetical protein
MAECVPELLKLFIPPLTTVLLGGFFVQKIFAHRSNQAAYVDHIIEELGELRKDALAYWSQATTEDTHSLIKQMEAHVKGRAHSLIIDLNYFRCSHESFWCKAYTKIRSWLSWFHKWLPEKSSPGYITAMIEVYDACTGDTFETEPHQASPDKYFSICSNISLVKSELLKVKL